MGCNGIFIDFAGFNWNSLKFVHFHYARDKGTR